MPKYSHEKKESILLKLLSGNISISDLAKQEQLSSKTLYAWRSQAKQAGRYMPSKTKSTQWDSQNKFQAVLETAGLNAEQLSAYCREKGLYPDEINLWRKSCIEGIGDSPKGDAKQNREQVKALKQSKKKLEQELRRKEKALAEAAALLVLQKKCQALWGDEE